MASEARALMFVTVASLRCRHYLRMVAHATLLLLLGAARASPDVAETPGRGRQLSGTSPALPPPSLPPPRRPPTAPPPTPPILPPPSLPPPRQPLPSELLRVQSWDWLQPNHEQRFGIANASECEALCIYNPTRLDVTGDPTACRGATFVTGVNQSDFQTCYLWSTSSFDPEGGYSNSQAVSFLACDRVGANSRCAPPAAPPPSPTLPLESCTNLLPAGGPSQCSSLDATNVTCSDYYDAEPIGISFKRRCAPPSMPVFSYGDGVPCDWSLSLIHI